MKVHHREEKMEKLGEVGPFPFFFFSPYFFAFALAWFSGGMLMVVFFFFWQVFQEMKDGKLIGRVVINLQ